MFKDRPNALQILCGALLLAIPSALFAANPPALTHYQGILRGANDEPLTGTYDMVFRFFDAESAGNEVMLDRHMTLNAKAVTVDGGLFSVALGSGLVVDGSGPGSYTSLADVFRDHAGVWLEVSIGAETLTPRTRVLATGYALNATTAETAGKLNGQSSSFYLDTSSNPQIKNGTIGFTAADPSKAVADVIAAPGSLGAISLSSSGASCKLGFGPGGTECYGSSFGGFFMDTTYNAWGYAGYAGHGIYGYGTIGVRGWGEGTSAFGGYFTSTAATSTGVYGSGVTYGGRFSASGGGSRAVYGAGGTYGGYFTSTSSSGAGVFGDGTVYGGHFTTSGASGSAGRFEELDAPGTYVNVAYSGYAIWSRSNSGIRAWDHDDSTYAVIGASPYKIVGSGAVSFVQNHPDESDQVVIYHAPESSEVNVYTRGSAKLTGGVARISLDPTFEWTANPDLGLTAHLTPRGEPVALAVESVTSRELKVRGPHGSDVEFDYWVTGLRIGFEEMPPVSDKEFDSPLPSEASGARVYAAKPGLRAFNALERHRAMGKQLGRGIDPDLRASTNLRDRIGLGRPMDATSPGTVPQPAVAEAQPYPAAETGEPRALEGMRAPPAPADTEGAAAADSGASSRFQHRLSVFFPAMSSIDAGDVVVIDPDRRGAVRRSDAQEDRTVVGVAVSAAAGGWAEVATASVIEVRVDAAYGAIRAGDLLVSSPTPGAAMIAPVAEPGTVLGKALESHENGLGTIRVLVMLR